MHDEATYLANVQLLGGEGPADLRVLQDLANELCIDAVREYERRSGTDELKALLSAVAEAQLVGADDRPAVRVAQEMVDELFSAH